MSDEQRGDGETTRSVDLGAFVGLADLDEDLCTMAQSSAEVERWRRISTRGMSAGSGEDDDAHVHAATTAPGSVAAPELTARHEALASLPETLPATLPPPASADSTRRLPSVRPELLAALQESQAERDAAHKSFAAPRDSASPRETPSGRTPSPLLTPRSSHPPGHLSSRPVKVPRPSQPPADDPVQVRGWRASDPASAEPSSGPDGFSAMSIPGPAPLPGAHRAAQATASPAAAGGPASAPLQVVAAPPRVGVAHEAAQPRSGIEVSWLALSVGLLALLVVGLGLVYLLLL